MNNFSTPLPVRASSPEDLYLKVQGYVSEGFDMYVPTVVLDGELVTWVAPYASRFIYVLVYAETIEKYIEEIQRLSGKGYDQLFASFEFTSYELEGEKKFWKCQWMAKEHTPYALKVERASAFTKPVMLEEALSALKVVVGVQKIPSFQILLGGA